MALSVYNVGRTSLLELLLAEMRNNKIHLLIVGKVYAPMSNLWHWSPSSARAVQFINVRPGTTMISPCLSPC